jgi:hypothetical protein
MELPEFLKLWRHKHPKATRPVMWISVHFGLKLTPQSFHQDNSAPTEINDPLNPKLYIPNLFFFFEKHTQPLNVLIIVIFFP